MYGEELILFSFSLNELSFLLKILFSFHEIIIIVIKI